jgi:hypothetical protein
MTIDEVKKIYKDRFKFNLTVYNETTLEPTISFVDMLDGKAYKIVLHHHILLDRVIENIVVEKRDNKIESILTKNK